MGVTTTVEVQTTTRDLVLRLGAARGQSADQVILAALEALQREGRRETAAAEARTVRDDPDDRTEIAAVQDEMAALHAR